MTLLDLPTEDEDHHLAGPEDTDFIQKLEYNYKHNHKKLNQILVIYSGF